MDHSELKAYMKGDDLIERWLYMEEAMEDIIRQEYNDQLMGKEVSVISNYQTIFGLTTGEIEKNDAYHEAIKVYVSEVEEVIHYFDMYKFHPDASISSRNGHRLTEIGSGIWSMVIMRLEEAYDALMATLEV